MKNLEPNARKMCKELTKNKKAYVDSVPKADLLHLESLIERSNNPGNVMRLFIGASDNIPSRAIGYVASAIEIARVMPVEQLQVVSVASLGSKVNDIDIGKVREEFFQFAKLSSHVLGRAGHTGAVQVSYVEDTDSSALQALEFTETTVDVLSGDEELKYKLLSRGSKHGGDAFEYAGAHFAYQDTGMLEVEGVLGTEPADVDTVVSVGCLQEKLFFAARQLIRNSVEPSIVMPSVQIFTLHASAPYFEATGGEQSIKEAIDTRSINFVNHNPATQRDLNHLNTIIEGGHHE